MSINRIIKNNFICLLFITLPTFLFSAKNNTDITKTIDSLKRITTQLYFTNIDSVFILAQKCLQLSELNNYEKGKANALRDIAIYYSQKNQYGLANDYMESALKFAKKTNNGRLISSIYMTMGFIQFEHTHLDKAYEFYYKAGEMFKKQGDSSSYAQVCTNIGNVFYTQGKLDLGLQYFNRSVKIFEQQKSFNNLVVTLVNIAIIHRDKGNYQQAKNIYNEILNVVNDADLRTKIISYIGLGEINEILKDFKESEYNYKMALNLAEKFNDNKLIGEAYYKYGKLFKSKKEYKKAIENMQVAYERISKSKDYLLLKQLTQSIAETYKEKKDYENALYFSDLSTFYNDSLNSKENTERLAKLKASEEYEIKIAQRELQYRIRITIIVFVSLISVFLVFVLLARHRKQKKQVSESISAKKELEKNLKQKDIDLLTKTMHLSEKEELILNLEEKLKKLSLDMKPTKAKKVQEIISDIRTSKSQDIWTEFESRFNTINDDFIERLKKEFSNLTPKELRLCSLLRLNLSTKEISIITHQNPMSINTARFRVRKKLNLNYKEIDLIDFLMDY